MGKQLSHTLSAATVCRLSVQYNRSKRGRGKSVLYRKPLSSCNMNVQIYDSNSEPGEAFSPISSGETFSSQSPAIKRESFLHLCHAGSLSDPAESAVHHNSQNKKKKESMLGIRVV